jgi:hypothetical protein
MPTINIHLDTVSVVYKVFNQSTTGIYNDSFKRIPSYYSLYATSLLIGQAAGTISNEMAELAIFST